MRTRLKIIVSIFCLFLLVGCSNGRGNALQGYVEGEYTNIAPLLSGRLQKLYVERGQSVIMGQRLFDLDPEPEASELSKAISDLASQKSRLKDLMTGQRSTVLAGIIAQREQAKADLDLAQSNYNRSAELYRKGVISKASYDQSLASLKSSQQRVNQFEQNLREAELGEREYRILQQTEQVKASEAVLKESKWRIQQKSISAPENALVYDTYFNEGEFVPANQPVMALLSPRFVKVIFYIPEPLRSKVAINNQVTFDCDGCQQRYPAYINYISSQAEYTPPVIFSRESRQKLVYRVQAKLPLSVATKVYPGQPVDVYLLDKSSTYRTSFWNYLWHLLKR